MREEHGENNEKPKSTVVWAFYQCINCMTVAVLGLLHTHEEAPPVWNLRRLPPARSLSSRNVHCPFMSWNCLHFLSVAPYLQANQVKLKTKLIYYMACKAAAFKETGVYQQTIMFYTRPQYYSVKDSIWDKHLLVVPTCNFWERHVDERAHISAGEV